MSEKWFDTTPKKSCFTCVYGLHGKGHQWPRTKCCNKKSPFHGKICKECTKSRCSKWLWYWSKKGQRIYQKHVASKRFDTCYCGLDYEVKGVAKK